MRVRTLVVLLIVFASLPFAAASNQVTTQGGDIQGRTILFDLTRFDPHLAAVAGEASATVSWFNGAISFNRGDEGWVYAAPAGAPDPTGKRLVPTGTWFNFTDHNGATWNVQEWFYMDVQTLQYRLGDQTATERVGIKVHVWTVETSKNTVRDIQLERDYNFVVVVDTNKLGVTPVDADGNPIGDSFIPGDGGGNQIDLYFSQNDPADRCSNCGQ
jgi:hypothetical protein